MSAISPSNSIQGDGTTTTDVNVEEQRPHAHTRTFIHSLTKTLLYRNARANFNLVIPHTHQANGFLSLIPPSMCGCEVTDLVGSEFEGLIYKELRIISLIQFVEATTTTTTTVLTPSSSFSLRLDVLLSILPFFPICSRINQASTEHSSWSSLAPQRNHHNHDDHYLYHNNNDNGEYGGCWAPEVKPLKIRSLLELVEMNNEGASDHFTLSHALMN